MTTSIADLRREYARARLDEADVSHDPFVEFARWFAEAQEAQVPEPNAMTLATATAEGAPSARIVLLKAFDERGFVFFTDYRSRKGAELETNPRAALVFWWGELERQVRITGGVGLTSREDSERYFESRPIGSRLGAWASHQSDVIAGRAALEADLRGIEARFAGGRIPLPPHWGGFRVVPDTIEFWQGRESRLHDRIRYVREGAGRGWKIDRLSP
ncbi:MAG TPA: pyridoxamine 5'-phosphate oxidase [Gemmatimonadales bacterium]|nr:pyridoxamine 5'-phosphate oxidase [Gemmatimonadales bacterium]